MANAEGRGDRRRGPPPRGGERREPNPLFLSHAAAISELYVTLKTGLPEGLRLAGFEREAEAREAFRGYDGKEHAVAPDACIQIAEADGRVLLGLVELDLGTMSTRRLKAKAEGYGEYAKLEGWRRRNEYCPPLLFITTSEKRARSFLPICRHTVDRREMLVAACGLARDIGRSLVAPEWLAGDEEGSDLLAVLRGARRPYDEACEREEAERREKDAERERLRSDPTALREHLRRWRHRDWDVGRLGPVAATALEITLERDGELAEAERRGLLALGAMFADPLHLQLAAGELSAERRSVLDKLAEHQRRRQLEEIEEMARRCGDGPGLRKARRRLAAGELLTAADASWLRQEVRRILDAEARRLLAEQLDRDSVAPASLADRHRLHRGANKPALSLKLSRSQSAIVTVSVELASRSCSSRSLAASRAWRSSVSRSCAARSSSTPAKARIAASRSACVFSWAAAASRASCSVDALPSSSASRSRVASTAASSTISALIAIRCLQSPTGGQR